MSIPSNVPNGYSNAYASSLQAPASTSLYGTLTSQPTPGSSSQNSAYAPAPSWSSPSSSAPLMRAPNNYAPAYSGHIHESDDDLLQLSSPPTNGKQPPNPVILATIPIYLAFLSAVIAAVSLRALTSTRGRDPKLSYSTKPDSPNVKYRNDALIGTKDAELAIYKREVALHDPSGKNTKDPRFVQPQMLDQGSAATVSHDGYVTNSKNVITHNGWWEHQQIALPAEDKLHASTERIHIGFHDKGALFAGTEVTAEHGVVTVAHPNYIHPEKAEQFTRHLHSAFAKAGLPATAIEASGSPLHATSPVHGPLALGYLQVPIKAGDAGHEQMKSLLHALGVDPNAFLATLQKQGRLAEVVDNKLNMARSFDEQYELGSGNQSIVKSGKWARGYGLVKQRGKEFVKGYRSGWRDVHESGLRLAYMNQTSVPLTAGLVFLTSILAWSISYEQSHQAKQKQAQSEH